MFVSNFFFGQGMFTPFQMLGMGLVGFICGLIFHKKSYSNNKLAVSIIGGFACFIVYGIIVDSCSFLMMSTDFTFTYTVRAVTRGTWYSPELRAEAMYDAELQGVFAETVPVVIR